MDNLNKIRKLAGLQEAPMDLDPVKIMAQRLDQLEKIQDGTAAT